MLPMESCCCGRFMDSGAYFPSSTSSLPVKLYLSDELASHATSGFTLNNILGSPDQYVFLPGKEQPKTWCGEYKHAEPGSITLTDGAYSAANYKDRQISIQKPPYRWTGRARLAAQAMLGIRRLPESLLGTDYDNTGIVISPTWVFWLVKMTGSNATLERLSTRQTQCLVAKLRNNEVPSEALQAVIAHVLARVTIESPKTTITLPFEAIVGGLFNYGWHFSYLENKCAIVTFEDYLEGWNTKCYELEFTFSDDLPVNIARTVLESGYFKPIQYTNFFRWNEATSTYSLVEGSGSRDEGAGGNVPVYCHYRIDTAALEIYHFDYSPAQSGGSAGEEPSGYECRFVGSRSWEWYSNSSATVGAYGNFSSSRAETRAKRKAPSSGFMYQLQVTQTEVFGYGVTAGNTILTGACASEGLTGETMDLAIAKYKKHLVKTRYEVSGLYETVISSFLVAPNNPDAVIMGFRNEFGTNSDVTKLYYSAGGESGSLGDNHREVVAYSNVGWTWDEPDNYPWGATASYSTNMGGLSTGFDTTESISFSLWNSANTSSWFYILGADIDYGDVPNTEFLTLLNKGFLLHFGPSDPREIYPFANVHESAEGCSLYTAADGNVEGMNITLPDGVKSMVPIGWV